MQRLKYGATKNMTPEEYKQYKRDLSKRWRDNNPEKIKKQNKYYSDLYKKTKPFVCICSKCGCSFHASRNYYKICEDCKLKPSKRQILLQERKNKHIEKIKLIEEVKYGYKCGIQQAILAENFGVTQKTISNWINKK